MIIDNIIKNGKSEYTVIYPNEAAAPEIFAAKELVKYLKQASGAELSIRKESDNISQKFISIGKTRAFEELGIRLDREEMNDDGFIIKTVGKNLFLTGAMPKGTIYSVYDFLEKFIGLKFVAEDCTIVPSVDVLDLCDWDIVEIPDFAMRAYMSGMTTWGHEENIVHMRMGHEYARVPEEMGGNMYWSDVLKNSHNTLEYVPPEIYYTEENKAENAHMYYEINGKVMDICFTDGITDDGELDETMPVSCAKVAIESLKRVVLASKPDCKYFMLGQMDIQKTFCECKRCVAAAEKYKRSGILIRFANVVARHIQKWADEELNGRKINIVIFAYQYTEMAPVEWNSHVNAYELLSPQVEPAENIYIRLAPIEASFYYPFSHPKQIQKYAEWFKQWQACGHNFMIWTYHTMFAFSFFWYYPTLPSWNRNIEEFKNMGVSYVFLQSSHNESQDWKAIMETYIASKKLWNSKLDVYDLQAEFNAAYYSIAAPYVNAFIDMLDKHYKKLADDPEVGAAFNIYDGALWDIKNMPYEFLQKLLGVLEEGVRKVENSDLSKSEQRELLKRLSRVKLTPLYMLMYNYGNYRKNDMRGRAKIAKQFFDICDKLGVQYYAEGPMIKDLKEKYLDEKPGNVTKYSFRSLYKDPYHIDIYRNKETLSYNHVHDFWEFMIVAKGRISLVVNGRKVELCENEILLIRPPHRHSLVQSESKPNSEVINVSVVNDYMLNFLKQYEVSVKEFQELAENIIHIKLNAIQSEMLMDLVLETEKKNYINDPNLNAFKNILLAEIMKNVLRKKMISQNGYPEWIENMMIAMNNPANYSMQISDFYKMSGYGKTYCTKLFTENVGMSPIKYFTHSKINYACMLLDITDNTILQIANEIGFYSLSHFNHCFLTEKGMTPNQYRKRGV